MAWLIGIGSMPARASPPADELVSAELLAEPQAIAPGEPFWVGVRLRLKPGWHVYWRNPGDSGEAPTITWHLPPGFTASSIAWPTPVRIPIAHLVNFGYEGETMLLTRIAPAAELSDAVNVVADITWLVCERECIPGQASLSLSLPVARGGTLPADRAQELVFAAARSDLPRPSPWRARIALEPERLTLVVDAKPLATAAVRAAYFFPNAETLVRHAAPQELTIVHDGLRLRLERSPLSTAAPADAGGVLLVEEGDGATTARHVFDLTDVLMDQAPAPNQSVSPMAVLHAAVLALLGGIILNLMPCVFPVLSIKVLGLIEQAGTSRNWVRRHGLAYTAGVLVAFAALGTALMSMRAAGAEVGWGFQLQSRVAVVLFAYLLFAVGLNLSGVFQLGSSLQGLGHRWARRSGLSGSFFTGALAAVVATPCTAPFMATALGFAFTQPAAVALIVMLALGLGLALPYLGLTLAPQLIPRLPRPGAWMETLRQMLGFPVYATAAWLIWVLAQQVSPGGLFAALAGLVLVGLAGWSFNRAQSAGEWGRRVAQGALLAALVGVAVTVVAVELDRNEPASAAPSATQHEPFTQARLDELIATRRPVFVNLTAAWCITCLLNERTALASAAVEATFAAKGITYLTGDWTRRNPEITRLLEKFGRSGVPLYLLFSGDGAPAVLPQLLTSATVLAAVSRIPEPGGERTSLPDTTKE
ncbi:MAG TPA: protein-disulfide reductase DsbD domain-containing protein [Hyphomicrobiaceae bacterium]|nr:protein-disulfide reductase DsbD domain-containing protein [Hyphomicrobiaceae bacterium]